MDTFHNVRCGMIYMESHKLGWRPLMKSYLSQLPETFSPEQKTLLSELFEWLVPACLKTIKDTPLNIRYSELHLFTSLTKIFSAVMDVPNMKTTGGCNTKVVDNLCSENLRQNIKVFEFESMYVCFAKLYLI